MERLAPSTLLSAIMYDALVRKVGYFYAPAAVGSNGKHTAAGGISITSSVQSATSWHAERSPRICQRLCLGSRALFVFSKTFFIGAC